MASKIEELKNDIAELNRLIDMASRTKVKDILTIEIRKLETEIIKMNEQYSADPQSSSTNSQKIAQPVQRCYDVKLTNYAWDQSDKFVKLFVTLKNVQSLEPSQVSCTFSKREVKLGVRGLDNRNYFLTINNLMKDIDETKSHWKVKTDMVVVFLSKSESVKWSHLTASESKLKDSQKKELDDMGTSDDPSQGLMNLMMKMYNEGDDEMKRTIAKAWTEGRDKSGPSLDL